MFDNSIVIFFSIINPKLVKRLKKHNYLLTYCYIDPISKQISDYLLAFLVDFVVTFQQFNLNTISLNW